VSVSTPAGTSLTRVSESTPVSAKSTLAPSRLPVAPTSGTPRALMGVSLIPWSARLTPSRRCCGMRTATAGVRARKSPPGAAASPRSSARLAPFGRVTATGSCESITACFWPGSRSRAAWSDGYPTTCGSVDGGMTSTGSVTRAGKACRATLRARVGSKCSYSVRERISAVSATAVSDGLVKARVGAPCSSDGSEGAWTDPPSNGTPAVARPTGPAIKQQRMAQGSQTVRRRSSSRRRFIGSPDQHSLAPRQAEPVIKRFRR